MQKNSLYNIRIKFEWLINKLRECSQKNEEIQKLCAQFEEADKNTVTAYCHKHSTGITIKQLEDDATTHKWNSDTTKAIAFVLGHIKKK